ncbi:MAG: sigma-54-dependent Fis family transcriptional regulator [Planctomycetes bacterium]|nr:sigma-54-dependent Fis family transcriptional regulator [Planctomycetota bacterium]
MMQPSPLLLVVDDAEDVRLSLEMSLQYEGYRVATAPEAASAFAVLAAKSVDLVLLDVKMPGMDGIEALPKMLEKWPGLPVLMISGHADIRTAVEAVKLGAEDFLEKPLDTDRVLVAVRNALRRRNLEQENRNLRELADRSLRWIGESDTSKKLLQMSERAAASDARVLVVGESGVGKELLVRRIHAASARSRGPLEVLPCASVPVELLEDELFGHEPGAFSGASQRRAGAFERAHGGSLLLDEVGELPLEAQAKILRVLETGTFVRLGGDAPIHSDARVFATTHHDLKADVAAGRFRQDLYYRLSVVVLTIPPLRERPADIPPLIRDGLAETARRARRLGKRMTPEAEAILAARPWRGNVRELRNTLDALALVVDGPVIQGSDVRAFFEHRERSTPRDPFEAPTLEEFRNAAERMYLEQKVASLQGNLKRTAEVLGISRSNLYKTLERLGLKPPPNSAGDDSQK